MKKRFFAVAVMVAIILCMSISFSAVAETLPVQTTVPVATAQPVDTTPATDPVIDPTATQGITDTAPATTAPSTTAPVDTTPHTNPPEPTEPNEDSTYSDYVSPAPVYTPADQDFDENKWSEIKLDIDKAPAVGADIGRFDYIQQNNSKGNDIDPKLLFVGIALVAVALGGITFAILYNPKKARAKAGADKASSQSTRSSQGSHYRPKRERKPDDYNDGY